MSSAPPEVRPREKSLVAPLHHARDTEEILRRLGSIDLLRALPPEEIQELVAYADALYIAKDTRFIDEGQGGDALYFIEQGTARVDRSGVGTIARVGPGSVVGEIALLTGTPRTASVFAETDLIVWRISRAAFDDLVARSPELRSALERVADERISGAVRILPSAQYWVSTALRAIDARYRGITTWQLFMFGGLFAWALLFVNTQMGWFPTEGNELGFALAELTIGLLILQGSCEAFIHGVERLGARLRWDGFISGTVGSLLSTLPEFVVIAFLVRVDPFAAFVTAVVTVFNNALAFSIYSFFLPKDRSGAFAMPRSLTSAGGEILIAGGAISLTIGLVMVVLRSTGESEALVGFDLIGIGLVLMATYAYYIVTLVQYYSEGKDDRESMPPDPEHLGHDTRIGAITGMFALGIAGAYCGGESIGGFAEVALGRLGLPTIPTAAALAFFAGISEYIIVYKSHRRGELGLALSNVFGGMTQVMFLLLPFALMMIGILGFGGHARYIIPINATTMLLVVLLFPLFYALHEYLDQEKSLTNLDAVGMTGIYLLLLYFLFTSPA